MKRLMIISCSSMKSNALGTLFAIDRYEGTTYRIIKKARQEGYWPEDTHIFIISAKYGLISEHTPIEAYDQKMTAARAVELQSTVSEALDILLEKTCYKKIFLNIGKIYMKSIISSHRIKLARQRGILQDAVGGIGERQKQVKAWIIEQHKWDLGNLYL